MRSLTHAAGVAACLVPACSGLSANPQGVSPLSASLSAPGGGTLGGPGSSSSVSRRDWLIKQSVALAASAAVAGGGGLPAEVADAEPEAAYSLVNERIFDTQRRSFLPPAPQRLIHPGSLGPLVCVGEEHSHPMHHRMEFNIIKAVHEHSQRDDSTAPLAIGLEMFYRQHQTALDRYVFRHGSLGRLKLETGWEKVWGYDFNNYSKIFRFARLHGIRLVGLNAPLELVSMVSRGGLEALPRELKTLLPDMDLSNESHRQRFDDAISAVAAVHPVGGDALGRMYEAQTLWDEYMSETAANYLNSRGGRMVLLAGSRHIESRDGIPDRVHRRTGGPQPFTIVPLSVDWTQEGLPDIDYPPGPSFADWIYFTQKELDLVPAPRPYMPSA